MDIYLPIAGQSVNALVIAALGLLVGVLSGMFGVGGGFLTTPLLIFYGIPPTVAVASATTQITGASVSGVMVHMRRGGVDFKMGGVMIAGGLFGTKVVLNEFVAFIELGQLGPELLSERSRAIVTFALCGFANFSSIAIQMAVTGGLAPNQRPVIAKLGLRALAAGSLANLMSAALAGLFLPY